MFQFCPWGMRLFSTNKSFTKKQTATFLLSLLLTHPASRCNQDHNLFLWAVAIKTQSDTDITAALLFLYNLYDKSIHVKVKKNQNISEGEKLDLVYKHKSITI